MHLLTLVWFLGTSTLSMGGSTPPKLSRNVPMCLRNLQKVFGPWGPNRTWDIDLPTPPCICSTWSGFWALVLDPWMCQHLPSNLEMFLCVSRTSKKYLVHGALIEPEILTSPSPMYLLNLGQLWVLALCPQVCQHLPSDLEMFLCVSGLQKIFGAWGPNRSWDIDLPTPPCICSTWSGFCALVLDPWMCQHLPSNLEMFLCVSGTSKKYLVHGALTEPEILTSPSPMYLLNLGQLWVLALCPQVCQHLPSNLEMFLCVSRTYIKYLVHGALIEAEILTSQLPHAFAQLSPVLSAGTLPAGVSTPPKWSRNVPMCLRNLHKVFGTWGPNRSWDIDLPTPPCICSTWPGLLGTSAQPMDVSTPSK